jgi:hypothetical protein
VQVVNIFFEKNMLSQKIYRRKNTITWLPKLVFVEQNYFYKVNAKHLVMKSFFAQRKSILSNKTL